MSEIQINQVLAQMRAMSVQAKSNESSVEASNNSDFSSMLKQSLEGVNKAQKEAGELSAAFEAGTTDASLAEVMVELQKASLSFQTVLQTRNKLVEAYKDVMRMSM